MVRAGMMSKTQTENIMQTTYIYQTNWLFTTLASCLTAALFSLYHTGSMYYQIIQTPLHIALTVMALIQIRNVTRLNRWICILYPISVSLILMLTPSELALIYLAMYCSLYNLTLSKKRISAVIAAVLTAFSASQSMYWHQPFPWEALLLWAFVCLLNWLTTRNMINTLKTKYTAQQNLSELKATQQLIASIAQQQERLYLSRELHDSIGHQLTALSIHLDIARRQSETPVQEYIQKCHMMSQNILQDIRDIVATQRQTQTFNLQTSLQKVISQVPQLKCHLSIEQEPDITEQDAMLCIIRVYQELISNTLKHSLASEFFTRINIENKQLQMICFHNAPESNLPRWGNGLSGVSERVKSIQGEFTQELNSDGKLINILRLPIIQ